MNTRTDAQNSPESGATPEHDLRVGSQGAGLSGADLERQRVIRDCAHMMQTLVVRLETGDDATRARIQRRLARIIQDLPRTDAENEAQE